MPVSDNGRTYQVVFYCSTTVAGNQLIANPKYPGIVAAYEHSFALLENLPCDVFLAPHPSFFHMVEKVEELKAGNRNAFVDPTELERFVIASEKDFKAELARQKASHSQTSRISPVRSNQRLSAWIRGPQSVLRGNGLGPHINIWTR